MVALWADHASSIIQRVFSSSSKRFGGVEPQRTPVEHPLQVFTVMQVIGPYKVSVALEKATSLILQPLLFSPRMTTVYIVRNFR